MKQYANLNRKSETAKAECFLFRIFNKASLSDTQKKRQPPTNGQLTNIMRMDGGLELETVVNNVGLLYQHIECVGVRLAIR